MVSFEHLVISLILVLVIVMFLMVVRWRWPLGSNKHIPKDICQSGIGPKVLHQLEQKDSLDKYLNVLTKNLAEKESNLHLSIAKLRGAQLEVENLQASDLDVQDKYQAIMDELKEDLIGNKNECRKLQEQIEWMSRRRAEIREEVRSSQQQLGEKAADLGFEMPIKKPNFQRASDEELRAAQFKLEPRNRKRLISLPNPSCNLACDTGRISASSSDNMSLYPKTSPSVDSHKKTWMQKQMS